MKSLLIHILFTFLLIIAYGVSCYGQTFETVYRNESNKESNFYLARIPSGEIKAWMVLLPSYGEMPIGVLSQSNIPSTNFENHIATFILSLKGAETFYLDDESQKILAEFIHEISKKYNLAGKKFVIGGFSLGGSAAVKYAELSSIGGTKYISPDMVFAGDPPLDIERINNSLLKILKRNTPIVGVKEATFLRTKMKEYFGTDEAIWYNYSSFSNTDSTDERIKGLTTIPIRLYSEPDIEWMLMNRHYDYYSTNSIDCAALINELQLMGNTNAAFVATTGKGQRANGQRHPHSWSIIDGQDLVNWILK